MTEKSNKHAQVTPEPEGGYEYLPGQKEKKPYDGPKFWLARTTIGPKMIFKDPTALRAACFEYFEWFTENILSEAKASIHEGEVIEYDVPKVRAPTIGAMCRFIGCSERVWRDWRVMREDLKDVIAEMEGYLFQFNYEHAAAGHLKEGIVKAQWQLADRQEVTNTDGATNRNEASPLDLLKKKLESTAARNEAASELMDDEEPDDAEA